MFVFCFWPRGRRGVCPGPSPHVPSPRGFSLEATTARGGVGWALELGHDVPQSGRGRIMLPLLSRIVPGGLEHLRMRARLVQ